MSVKLISITQGTGELSDQGPQEIIAYAARVSNPNNQMNFETSPKLLKYLIEHKHWSPFEMANLTMEITTSRAIAQQILRHKSFVFQEFSQRYSTATNIIKYPARRQDNKNRQNSIDDMSQQDKDWFDLAQDRINSLSNELYQEALTRSIAKEQARFLLPLSTETKLYMCGSVRSWIHYIQTRTDPSTQKEHREIAEACKQIFIARLPDVAKALGWTDDSENQGL